MNQLKSARELARMRGPVSLALSILLLLNFIPSTHSGAAAAPAASHFIDPSAVVQCGAPYKPCSFGSNVYVGPFAALYAGPSSGGSTPFITIGNDSDVQDNTILDTTTNNKAITLGDNVIIAHGAAIYGGARIGVSGVCPPNIRICASFVGFNSEVAEDAVVERNAMVTHLAKVGHGVTIPSGRVVLPGMDVEIQSQVPSKTIAIVDADHAFMAEVISVNIALAQGYTVLEANNRNNVLGISINPITPFTPTSISPTLDGRNISNPNVANRIIGDVRFTTALPQMGKDVSIRADEGAPFVLGTSGAVANYSTFHALKSTQLSLGANGRYGIGSLMHGGKFNSNVTRTGANFDLGNDSVFYSATAGDNCHIGAMSFVTDTNLPTGTDIPPKLIVMAGNRSPVEWTRRPRLTISRGKRKP